MQEIEGHIVINNGFNLSNVMSFVVLKDDFLKRMVAQQRENVEIFICLHPETMSFGAARQQAASSQGRLRTQSKATTAFSERETISLTPFSLQLIVYKNNEKQTAQQWRLLAKFLKLLCMGLVLSSTLAYYFANRFLYPFRVLDKAVKEAGKHTPLRKIPEEPFEAKRFSSTSIRRKILLLLAVSVIVPGVFFGVSINRVMYAYTMEQNKEISLETSQQMALKLRNKMDEYETMTKQLSEDPQLTTFLDVIFAQSDLRVAEVYNHFFILLSLVV